MLGLPTAIADLVIPKWVKLAIPVGIVLVIVGGFFLWLHFHDNGVRKADRAALDIEATAQAAKAADAADGQQIERQEQFNASQDEVRNASDADDYFKRLRASQCKANPARCK